jgi:hypothetical protein
MCRIEHKEKLSATTKVEQYAKKYERECEKVSTLERENAFLLEQVSSMKGEIEVCCCPFYVHLDASDVVADLSCCCGWCCRNGWIC